MPLQERLREIAEKIADEQGATLIDVEVKGDSSGALFLIYADTDAGITLGECVEMSRAIQDEVDMEDGFPQRYRLEVSSPGLTRPLTTDFQLKKNMGKTVSVRYMDEQGKTQKISGDLAGFTPESLDIKLKDGLLRSLDRINVKSIKIKLQW